MDSEEVRRIIEKSLENNMKIIFSEFRATAAETSKQYELIELKLSQIQEQTTKTNGRVTRLETEPHPVATCPHKQRLDDMEEFIDEERAKKKVTWSLTAFIATAVGVITGLLALL